MASETLKDFVEKCAESCNCNAETNTANQAKVLISKLAEKLDEQGTGGGGESNGCKVVSESFDALGYTTETIPLIIATGETLTITNMKPYVYAYVIAKKNICTIKEEDFIVGYALGGVVTEVWTGRNGMHVSGANNGQYMTIQNNNISESSIGNVIIAAYDRNIRYDISAAGRNYAYGVIVDATSTTGVVAIGDRIQMSVNLANGSFISGVSAITSDDVRKVIDVCAWGGNNIPITLAKDTGAGVGRKAYVFSVNTDDNTAAIMLI